MQKNLALTLRILNTLKNKALSLEYVIVVWMLVHSPGTFLNVEDLVESFSLYLDCLDLTQNTDLLSLQQFMLLGIITITFEEIFKD